MLAALVLALTMYDDDASVFAVLRAGARGYVLKGAHQAELVAAIRAVARGEAVFGALVADRVLAHFATPPAQRPALPELTERERQVLAMLAGQTTSDIAAHLALAPKTVRNHLSYTARPRGRAHRIAAGYRRRAAGHLTIIWFRRQSRGYPPAGRGGQTIKDDADRMQIDRTLAQTPGRTPGRSS